MIQDPNPPSILVRRITLDIDVPPNVAEEAVFDWIAKHLPVPI